MMSNTVINSDFYNKIAALKLAETTKKQAQTDSASTTDFSDLLQKAVNTTKPSSGGSLDDIFKRAAAQYNVPENLLKAVAKAESGYDANAVSSCGAQGVMQLMPSTAAALGVQNPFDAEQNIMGGAKYLNQMLSRYDGNAELALAAYNAGSGNVAKYGGIPPFKETQTYVARVMDYAGLKPSDQLTSLNTLANPSSSSDQLSAMNTLFSKASPSDRLSALGYLMDGSSSDGQSSSLDSLFGNSSSSDLSSYLNSRFSNSSDESSSLSSLLGASSSSDQLSALSALLSKASASGGLSSSSGTGGLSSQQYSNLLQVFLAQIQMNSSQTLASDLSGSLDSDSDSSSLI
jgi:hypothetical protein